MKPTHHQPGPMITRIVVGSSAGSSRCGGEFADGPRGARGSAFNDSPAPERWTVEDER